MKISQETTKRKGQIQFNPNWANNPLEFFKIQHEVQRSCLVLSVDYIQNEADGDIVLAYSGISNHFRIVKEGEDIPTYVVELERKGLKIRVNFVEVHGEKKK